MVYQHAPEADLQDGAHAGALQGSRMSEKIERVIAEVGRARDEHLGLLRELIGAQREGEEAVQSIVFSRLERLGADVERIRYAPAEVPLVGEFAAERAIAEGERGSVVGRLRGSGGGRSLLLFAHPDSEPLLGLERWERDPFAGAVENGRIYGWGVADDLAGVAAGIAALGVLKAVGLRPGGDVVMASTPSKRHARGVAAMMHQGYEADGAVYLHPAESGAGLQEVKAFASGQLEFRVTVEGRRPPTTEPGHTAFAHLAVNPLDKAIVLYRALMALGERRARSVRHPALEAAVGRSTNLQIASMTCGEDARFSRLSTTCSFGGALSFPPGERLEDVCTAVKAAIDEAAAEDEWMREHPPLLEWISGVTGIEVPESSPLYRTVSDAVVRVTGAAPHVNPLHTSSDIRNPVVQKGIPTVGLGPLAGDLAQVGGHDEWVDVESYLDMVKVTAAIVASWTEARA